MTGPTRTRIKICGVRDEAAARAASDAGADAIGLVLAATSPRAVTLEEARSIAASVPPLVTPVAVF